MDCRDHGIQQKEEKKEISHWEKNIGDLYDICELAEWLEGKDISIINTLPRFFWFDDEYKQTIEELGLIPNTENIMMYFMVLKDNLNDDGFEKRLKHFSLYLKSQDSQIVDELKTWKMGKRFKSWKSYQDSVDYANKYMYVFCKQNHYNNEYKIEKKLRDSSK